QYRLRLNHSLKLCQLLFDFDKSDCRNLQVVTAGPKSSQCGFVTKLHHQIYSLEGNRNKSAFELSWLGSKVFVPWPISDNGGTSRFISVPDTGFQSSELNEHCQSVRGIYRS